MLKICPEKTAAPLQNIIQDEGLEEIVYGDDEKCELLNKYFSFIGNDLSPF
jgi:hypothetical protein